MSPPFSLLSELVDLPLVKFDFSCNKVLVIPVCFREMKQLQVLLLENNPLQSPPAQVRICLEQRPGLHSSGTSDSPQSPCSDSLCIPEAALGMMGCSPHPTTPLKTHSETFSKSD